MNNAMVSGNTRNACERIGGESPTTSTTSAARAAEVWRLNARMRMASPAAVRSTSDRLTIEYANNPRG